MFVNALENLSSLTRSSPPALLVVVSEWCGSGGTRYGEEEELGDNGECVER